MPTRPATQKRSAVLLAAGAAAAVIAVLVPVLNHGESPATAQEPTTQGSPTLGATTTRPPIRDSVVSLEAEASRGELSALADWASNFESTVDFTEGQDWRSGPAREVAALSKEHPVPDSASAKLIRRAASQLSRGESALKHSHFKTAKNAYHIADQAISGVPKALQADRVALEKSSGNRMDVRGDVGSGTAVVVRWKDGDSLITSVGEVRLIGINAAELSTNCPVSQEAADFSNQAAPPGSTIALVDPASVTDRDRYGRLLRYVTLPDGNDLGLALIKAGLARAEYDATTGFEWHPAQADYRGQPQPEFPEGCATEPPPVLPADLADGGAAWASALAAATVASKSTDAFPAWIDAAVTTAREAAIARAEARARALAEARAKAAARARAAAAARVRAAAAAAANSRPPRSSSGSSGGSSGGYPGYTGPRCYAPGGQTWRPC